VRLEKERQSLHLLSCVIDGLGIFGIVGKFGWYKIENRLFYLYNKVSRTYYLTV